MLEEKVYNKLIINTVTWSDALYHISRIFPDLTLYTLYTRLVWYFDLEISTRRDTMSQIKLR